MAARLQEMPGEEGYPNYLANRLGQFFERAGRVRALGSPERDGAVTIIGAISPPGGDFSEPVTQASLRVAGAMWALDASLAHQRHYPAVDWETSFSLYAAQVAPWFAKRAGANWAEVRADLLELLQKERELRDIASLVGPDALEDRDHLIIEVSALIREGVLRQNAYHPNDAISSPEKTFALAAAALALLHAGEDALTAGTPFASLDLVPVRRALVMLRDAADADVPAQTAEVMRLTKEIAPRVVPHEAAPPAATKEVAPAVAPRETAA
jgi:V/A-type H+-transporting ATPase subunit A